MSKASFVGELTLADVIDQQAVRSMLEDLYKITNIGTAVIDLSGKVLVSVGWQDICKNFHRRHPETLKNCIESNTVLATDSEVGIFKRYCCKNNMWDVVTPIEVDGRHVGNLFLGQFFYDDETIDYDLFRRQAQQYGFDEAEYIAALDRVPRWSRGTIDAAMSFYRKLAEMIASLSFSTVKLSRAISQQEMALEKLSENKAELRLKSMVLDQISDRVTVTDLDGIILYVNDAELESLGYSREELLGASITKYGKGPESDTVQNLILQETKRNGQWRGEVANQSIDGCEIVFDCRTQQVFDEIGNPIALCGIATDITERKRMEVEHIRLLGQLQQAQKMESVGRLAGGIAHDFNNMLGVILGHTEMIFDLVEPGQPIYFDLEEINKAAKRSADLTRQLLAFARQQTISPRVLDLNTAVEGILNMLQRLIGEGISLTWLPGENLWPVKLDPIQMDQVLTNLCVNARDSTGGTGKLVIKTGTIVLDENYCAEQDGAVQGEYLLLSVCDDGCGMDTQTQSKVFEPFFTTKEVGRGTGLGLATVYGIVKQNNGFIKLSSELGKGTTFEIYLPRYVGKQEQALEEDQGASVVGGQETILLVEDEPAILRMTIRMLRGMGYTVIAANSPGEAICLAREYSDKIQLLMTDVVMPEMNGRFLAKNLISIYSNIKCLFMSGYTADIIAHHGVLEKGINFIQKPFSKERLAAKVREALDRE